MRKRKPEKYYILRIAVNFFIADFLYVNRWKDLSRIKFQSDAVIVKVRV